MTLWCLLFCPDRAKPLPGYIFIHNNDVCSQCVCRGYCDLVTPPGRRPTGGGAKFQVTGNAGGAKFQVITPTAVLRVAPQTAQQRASRRGNGSALPRHNAGSAGDALRSAPRWVRCGEVLACVFGRGGYNVGAGRLRSATFHFMKITDLSIPLGFEQKYWNIMKPTYIADVPSVNTRARHFGGYVGVNNGRRSLFAALAPYWDVLTPEEKAPWALGFESSKHYPFAWFVRNLTQKYLQHTDITTVPDIIPYPSGYLEIPSDGGDVSIKCQITNPFISIGRVPHTKSAKKLYTTPFDYLPIAATQLLFYGRDVTVGAGGFIEYSVSRYTDDGSGGSDITTYAVNPSVFEGLYNGTLVFPFPGASTDAFVQQYILSLFFRHVWGKFYIKEWSFSASDTGSGGIGLYFDPHITHQSSLWKGTFRQANPLWYISDTFPGVVFDTRLSSLNGLT
jgi:hypothetical protein